MMENEIKEKEIKKERLMDNVKKTMETGMLCAINSETFYLFTKKTWICNSGDNKWWHRVGKRKFAQYCSNKKGKLHVKVHQVGGNKKLHILWLMKYCTKAGANLYFPTCTLLQGSKSLSNCKSNIVTQSTSDDFMVNHQIKTYDGWIARVNFLKETNQERAEFAKSLA